MFRCTECAATFYSQVDCDQHVEREHPESDNIVCVPLEYQCTFCGMIFPHQTDVSNHALRDHGIQRIAVKEVAPD